MWQITININLWNPEPTRQDILTKGAYIGPFSKGNASMRRTPQAGEEVIVVWKDLPRFRGRVYSGFQQGTFHQTDTSNTGQEAPHRQNNYFAFVVLTEVVEDPEYIKSQRRTWLWME